LVALEREKVTLLLKSTSYRKDPELETRRSGLQLPQPTDAKIGKVFHEDLPDVAATKQPSRLIHNPRLKPKDFAKWLCLQVLANRVPRSGSVLDAIAKIYRVEAETKGMSAQERLECHQIR
jgi:hypothetical protein